MSLINELVKQFQEITGIDETKKCLSMLRSNHYDVSLAVLKFYENDQIITEDVITPSTKPKTKGYEINAIKIRLFLPDCKIIEEEIFNADDPLIKLYNVIDSHGFASGECRICTNGSKCDLSSNPRSISFRQLNFSSTETIVVELKENIICWYKRPVETLKWELISSNRGILEKAYLENRESPMSYPLEIYLDDHADYVSVDFDRMVASAVYDTDVVLYVLKRKNGFDGLPVDWNWGIKTNDDGYQLVELDRRSLEFVNVSSAVFKNFDKTSESVVNFEIEKIERVENPHKYKQYLKLKQELEQIHATREGYVVERQLFHGTRPNNVGSICSYGFNPSLSGRHGAMYGNGCYFATNFLRSLQYGNAIFYANVLTGVFTVGHPRLKSAPELDAQNNIKYDSVVDKTVNPEIFVVFSDFHAYPAYLITRRI